MSLQFSIWLLKNTDLFYNNSTIDFIIIHSNFLIHTGGRNRNTCTYYRARFLVSTRYRVDMEQEGEEKKGGRVGGGG